MGYTKKCDSFCAVCSLQSWCVHRTLKHRAESVTEIWGPKRIAHVWPCLHHSIILRWKEKRHDFCKTDGTASRLTQFSLGAFVNTTPSRTHGIVHARQQRQINPHLWPTANSEICVHNCRLIISKQICCSHLSFRSESADIEVLSSLCYCFDTWASYTRETAGEEEIVPWRQRKCPGYFYSK